MTKQKQGGIPLLRSFRYIISPLQYCVVCSQGCSPSSFVIMSLNLCPSFQILKVLLHLNGFNKEPETLTNWLHCGVSDHHKASPDPIIFWKHHCAVMDHNNFMKQIGSITLILNPLDFFWRTCLYFRGFWEFFHVWIHCFWIFIKKNFLVTYIFKWFTFQNCLYWQDQLNLVEQILRW